MAKLSINKITSDWIDVKNKCRTTINKNHSEYEATKQFKRSLLKSEHSPIRLITVNWLWEGIKSWVATHYGRHHIGFEKWISTQRSDRINVDRNELPQGSLVNMECEANAQSLINMSRVRLCFQASPETRIEMEKLKNELHNQTETEDLADYMVPNCIYRCGCSEFEQCEARVWDVFLMKNEENLGELLDIDERYVLYNEDFYNRKNKKG